MVTIPSPYGV